MEKEVKFYFNFIKYLSLINLNKFISRNTKPHMMVYNIIKT